jgi:hypothetical protein
MKMFASVCRPLPAMLSGCALLVGCASVAKPVAVNAPPPPPAVAVVSTPAPVSPPVVPTPVTPVPSNNNPTVVDNVVSGTNWSFTVPNSNWVSQNLGDNDEALALLFDEADQRKAVLLHTTTPDGVDTTTFAVTVLAKVDTLDTDSFKPVNINGNTFFYASTTTTASPTVYFWFLVNKNIGYGFMCGGVPAADLATTCQGIAETLTIK